jgi:hypothetical protein
MNCASRYSSSISDHFLDDQTQETEDLFMPCPGHVDLAISWLA